MKTKKYFEPRVFSLLLILCICTLLCTGCFDGKTEASFLRMDIGKRTNDCYFDFLITIDNKTSHTETIGIDDFYIEINEEKIETVSFLYAYQEVFYTQFISIENENSLTLRVRAISAIRNNDKNTILVKFRDQVLVNDTVNIRENKQTVSN